MAPKRAAQPPPVESSEETDSGSGTDESEEEIAPSSPAAAATKSTAPALQKDPQAEFSDEEDEDEEEEEGEEEDEEEAPPATQNAPAPQPNVEESESEEEEEDGEEDGEAPEEAVQEKHTPPGEAKKPAEPVHKSWSKDDHVRILEALAAHHREHGKLPEAEDLEAAVAGRLDFRGYGTKELMTKVKGLKMSYVRAVNKGALPSKDPERRIFDLSKELWGGGGDNKPANGVEPRDFEEMSKLYPFLAEEVEALERTRPGLFKREFGLMDDAKARALDEKVKKQKMVRMKLELRRHDMVKDVTKTLMDLLH